MPRSYQSFTPDLRPPYPAEHLRENALGEAFVDYMRRWPGFVTDGADGLAGSDSNRFMGEGRRVGETLARALEFVVHVLTSAVSFFEGFVRVASRGIRVLEPTFRALGTVVRALAVAFGMLGGEVAAEAEEGASDDSGDEADEEKS